MVGIAQVATYNFSAAAGNQTSQPVASKDANITASDVVRGTGITATAGAGSINATGWNSVSQDVNDYYEFTLTPNSGYQLDITGIALSARRSATGPVNYLLSYSIAGSETTITTGTLSTTTSTSLSPVFSLKTPQAVRFRIYAWGASAAGGTFRLDNTLTVIGSAPLPVKLVSFTGQSSDNAVLLNWATSWEEKNEGFDILKGQIPTSLEKIGFIEGHTTTQEVSDYSFTDHEVQAGEVYYYQLRQRDSGGGSELSKIIAVRADIGDEAIDASVYPNPNQGSFTVLSTNQDLSAVGLFDPLGNAVPVTIRKSERPTSVSVNSTGYLAPGVYFLRLQDSNGIKRQSLKVIVE
ncbi:hypothetical protein GCM10028809_24630 [Spirosoma gilvum]